MMALRTPFLSIIFFYLVGDITFGNAAEVDALAGPFKKSSGACLVEHQVVVADELFWYHLSLRRRGTSAPGLVTFHSAVSGRIVAAKAPEESLPYSLAAFRSARVFAAYLDGLFAGGAVKAPNVAAFAEDRQPALEERYSLLGLVERFGASAAVNIYSVYRAERRKFPADVLVTAVCHRFHRPCI
jgi:hypothetical protein